MAGILAAKGEESEKLVGGQLRKVIPFAGVDRGGEFSSMGVGLIEVETGSGQIWGLVCPHSLIRSWRAMKILEKVPKIYHATLAACWYAGGTNLSDSDSKYLDELATQFENRAEFDSFREQVLNSAPSAEELDNMITALREKEVSIDSWEIEREVQEGRITSTETIRTLIADAAREREEYRRQQEEIKKPVAKEDSLSAFFEDLGIDNFIIGGGAGAYGMDWGHIKLEQLDEMAKQDSFSKHLPDGHRLERTIGSPKDKSFGEIEQPHFTAKDGTTFKFLFAKFKDGRFFVRTLVDKSEVAPYAGEFTIPQLRGMIGELPKRRGKLLGKLRSLIGQE